MSGGTCLFEDSRPWWLPPHVIWPHPKSSPDLHHQTVHSFLLGTSRSFTCRPSSPAHALSSPAYTRTTWSLARAMSSISPFRYVQVARYLLQRCLEDGPAFSRKGKGKAWSPPVPVSAGYSSGVMRAAALQERSSESSSFDRTVAGPSRGQGYSPDPDYPPEPATIYNLMNDERLLIPGAVRPPKEVVVLCHGTLLLPT